MGRMRRTRMRALIVVLATSLLACTPASTGTTPVDSLPGASPVCAALDSQRLDDAAKAYGAALDAVGLLIDAKVLVPGSARAKAVADANDRVLAAFNVADAARKACNATSYQ